MAREIRDHWFREARRRGYVSRAAFKLIEIDDRKRVLRHGDRVLDAGCAPGSWIQVAVQRVGRRGSVVGVDLKEVDGDRFGPTVRTVRGDIATVTAEELLGSAPAPDEPPPFDVILSDLGPDTTGDPAGDSLRSVGLCDVLLDRCSEWLRPGGHLVMKVYEGGLYPGLLERARSRFARVKGYKPSASRNQSVEIYVICHDRRAESVGTPARTASSSAGGEDVTAELPRRRPSSGWRNEQLP